MSSVSVVSFNFVLSLPLSLSCLIPASLAAHYRLAWGDDAISQRTKLQTELEQEKK